MIDDARQLNSARPGRAHFSAWLVGLCWVVTSGPLFMWIAFNSPLPMYILRKAGIEYGRNILVLHDMALYLGIALPFAFLVKRLAAPRCLLIAFSCSALWSILCFEGLAVSEWQNVVTFSFAAVSLPIATVAVSQLSGNDNA